MVLVHLHVHAACPCPCPCFMSMLNVHVSVHVHAAHHRRVCMCECMFVFVCINAGMPDCPAFKQSGTRIKKLMMQGQVRYQTNPRQSGIFLVRYQTEIIDTRMPMPALVSWMPMPSCAIQVTGGGRKCRLTIGHWTTPKSTWMKKLESNRIAD